MTIAATVVVPTATGWLRGLWVYYRRYTDTTVHTAAVAALTIFGILVFVDPWFAALAIASYVVPPVALYALDIDAPLEGDDAPNREQGPEPAATTRREQSAPARATAPEGARSSENRVMGVDGNTDSDSDDGDTDSDSDDGDTDSDSDDGDTDSDSDDGDTDSDSDDGDTDSDSDDGDTDSDSDDGDSDSDSDG